MRPNHVKQALAAGQVQIGTQLAQLRNPEVVRALGAAGLHWIFIDTEHGGMGIETVQDVTRACLQSNISPIVRVADLQYSLVARALDCGAQGIIFPRVESAELLAKAVSWTKFPPVGMRGFGLGPASVEWEFASIPQILSHVNEHTLVVLQIETQLAFERREELLSVPGVDVVLVGPADLSISLGIPGQFENPKLIETVEAIRDTCIAKGIVPGIHLRNVALAKFWRERGMRFLSASNELSMLFERAGEQVKALS